MANITKKDALEYHAKGRPGKIEVVPTKPYRTQQDLSLAYSPGVAEPCREIEKNADQAYRYTAKSNLVAVVSNGTAVLGLGDIGALAGKPVMEGKGLLFKIFADVDVFDIEVDEKDPDAFIKVVKAISPTFGGINLEDIKAPECFEIEKRLKEELDIPVFHDDQHGTAIISAAGLLNALELAGKKIEDVKIVVNGAGASAISCSRLYFSLGAKKEIFLMLDSKGIIRKDRKDLNSFKLEFAADTDKESLEEAMEGADVFIGLSKGNILSKAMVQSMADNPIVFAMANPDPEITYEKALEAREDIIMATGRSDYPNQVNNVLGFPFIFRGALDVKARSINEEMKIAAVRTLAKLAKEDVPESVNTAYNSKNLKFGRNYIIPKPLDPRLITRVAPAVAKAAMETGVARTAIDDWDKYELELSKRLGLENQLMRDIQLKAQEAPKRLVFAEANEYKVLKAVQEIIFNKIAHPILLGNEDEIKRIAHDNLLDISGAMIIDHRGAEEAERRKDYAVKLYSKRNRKGLMLQEANDLMLNSNHFGLMMVETGDADAFLSGFSSKYADVVRPALQITGKQSPRDLIAGMYIVQTKKGSFFFSDTTVNIKPNTQTIIETTLLTAEVVKRFSREPKIAILSYSNFGSNRSGNAKEAHEAVNYLHEHHPDLIVDGEMQANFAFNNELRKKKFPFSKLTDHDVNTLIFPNLSSGNIAYKMMQEIGDAEVIGPILLGIGKPIHVLQLESSVREIVNMATIAVVDAQHHSGLQ